LSDVVPGGGVIPAPHVFLGVPTYDGKVHVQFLRAVLETQLACLAAGIDLSIKTLSGNCHVDDAQNALIAEFLRTDCTDLFIIGSDQGWRAADFVRLCQHDRDIVAGAVIKKQEPETYTLLLDKDEIWSDREGLVEAHTIGSGFLRVRRRVLETLARESRSHCIPGREPEYVIFERWTKDGRRWSGDNVFCLKAKAAGFKIYIDPDVWSEHVGSKVWTGNVLEYWKREQEKAQ
jgi:hypothetical protein